jgi:hypothetical protein
MICGHYRESFVGHDESPKLAAKMAKGMPRWPPTWPPENAEDTKAVNMVSLSPPESAAVPPMCLAGGRKASDPLAQKAWQTGKLKFFLDATTMAVCAYSAN